MEEKTTIEFMICRALEFLAANGKQNIADYITGPIAANPGETAREKLAAATDTQFHLVRARLSNYFTWVKVKWYPVAVPIFDETGKLVVTEEDMLAERQTAILRAVQVLRWNVVFRAETDEAGVSHHIAEFFGISRPCGRSLRYAIPFDKIEEIADKLEGRWQEFDGTENARQLLWYTPDSFEAVAADIKDEEATLKELELAVRRGLEWKLPTAKQPGLYAAADFYEKLEKAKADPASPITPEAVKELDRLCGEVFDKPLYDIIRNWAVERKI